MEQPSRQAPRPPAESEPDPPPHARLESRLLVSFQYVHVQLAGGAPWGFTLRGGLEHGEPLLVSKVEDGGKAALSQKMRSGDELVNINGMPLYGSRQEALILIKGSYRTLKMIVRRRSVPVIRPHSWHLAKISEARSDAATMPVPGDAFSFFWHLGCDVSELPRPWNPLPPPGPAEKSSSLGSMESLEPPGQAYFEGSLSPIDQCMDHSKRDSAYSSFSASSNASDSALRPEEGSAQPVEARYLQTSGEPAEGTALPFLVGQQAPGARLPSGTETGSLPSPAQAAAVPPQPPVRQDSLRACEGPADAPGPLSQEGPLCPQSQWCLEPSLCAFDSDPHRPEERVALARPPKESLPTDQYYLLSSHTDRCPQMETESESPQAPWTEESSRRPSEELPVEKQALPMTGWTGTSGHRHSVPEDLLAAHLRGLGLSQGQEGTHWTVSPLHRSLPAPEPRLNRSHFGHSVCGQAGELRRPEALGDGSHSPTHSSDGRPERPLGAQAELPSALPPPLAGGAPTAPGGLPAAPSRESLLEGEPAVEGSRPAARKGSSAPPRPSQTRRRSDRFATNLRNEIQRRKAQLQKAKAPGAPADEEEPAQAAEQPPSCTPTPTPTPPPPLMEDQPRGSPLLPAVPLKRWGSELSVFGEGGSLGSHGRLPGAHPPLWPEPGKPARALPPTAGGGRGGRWRWSPEHKLQPQDGGLQEKKPPAEDSGLLPFADRRKFFEETSRPPPPPPTVCSGPPQRRLPGLRLPRAEEQEAFQPVSSPHRDPQRHSTDQPRWSSASPPAYQDCWPEVPLAHPGAEWECWHPRSCSCAAREGPACCCRDRWAALRPRGPPGPPSHQAPHYHPCPWARCRDCCCPAQPRFLEDGGSWPARKPFATEFTREEWQALAGNRGSSQSPRAFFPHQAASARVGPFWTCFESPEPSWDPVRRTMPAHTLPRDCEQLRRESVACEAEPWELCRPPRHGRSHLEEPARTFRKEEREARSPKPEETGPPCSGGLAGKRGPPPPRPPPPNWEKCRPRRASHHLLPSPEAAPPTPWGDTCPPTGQGGFEAARLRSQSLPLEQLCSNRSRMQLQPPGTVPCAAPGPPEQGSPPSSSGHSASLRTLEWLMPETSDQSTSSRAASSLEEEAPPEPPWDEEQKRPAGSPSEQLWAGPPSRPLQERTLAPEDAGGGGRCSAPLSRLDSEELRRDVAGRDRSLVGVLSSGLGLRPTAEVMGDLFAASDCSVWKGPDWDLPGSGSGGPDRQKMPPGSPRAGAAAACLAYYSLSAGKAELLNKMKDQPAPEEEDGGQDLAQKKMQLIESISRKLAVLQEAQQSLQDDISANVALGREVECHVKGVCRPHEFEKFRLFIGDLDKVVHLLLSLSGRLARVENALGGLREEEEEEKMSLLEKKRQLMAQLADAKDLQEHVAQRERLVFASISHCLPAEQLQDYQHFVRMTSALAVQQRQLDDKIKLGEEQLRCLRESLTRRPRDY